MTLSPPPASVAGAGLNRLGQPHVDAATGQLAPDPAPAGRGLHGHGARTALEARIDPAAELLAGGGETILGRLAAFRVDDDRLEDVLVDVHGAAEHDHLLESDRAPR